MRNIYTNLEQNHRLLRPLLKMLTSTNSIAFSNYAMNERNESMIGVISDSKVLLTISVQIWSIAMILVAFERVSRLICIWIASNYCITRINLGPTISIETCDIFPHFIDNGRPTLRNFGKKQNGRCFRRNIDWGPSASHLNFNWRHFKVKWQ